MIIGIGGRKGSGKDTVADILCNFYGFRKTAFANNLKEMCIEVFGVTHNQCYDERAKEAKLENFIILNDNHAKDIAKWVAFERLDNTASEFGMTNAITKSIKEKPITFGTTRFLLQYIGTEILRDLIHPDYHAIVTYKKIQDNGWDKVVISDTRFKNERDFISSKSGHNILIMGPKTEVKDGHRSENSLGVPEEYDWCIYNHKRWGIDQLKSDVTVMYRALNAT